MELRVGKFFEKILLYGRMIKFSHTVFALPFALSALVLATRVNPLSLNDFFWILAAMVGARSAAMGFNRIADAKIDEKNPRTAIREIPSGRLSKTSAWIFVIISSGVFIFSAAMLGRLPFILSFPILLILFSYSYTKRFTWLCHIWLGFAISLAPFGAWIAIAKTFRSDILWLSFALMTYIAGFDILYACQDIGFDKKEGLFSIPAKFGVKKALMIAKLIHSISFLSFLAIYFAFDMGSIYLMTVSVIGFLLMAEHWLVDSDDLSRIDVAFFNVNSIISIALFTGVFLDELIN